MSKGKILIVDDEPDILDFLEYNFKKEGYSVLRAIGGKDAIKIASREIPDTILLDIMMPDMDGIEVCRQLRKKAILESSKIIILTARGEDYSEVAGFEAGADDYVTKPIRFRSLLKRIEVLEGRLKKDLPDTLEVGIFRIDRGLYQVAKGDSEFRLPRKEFELLYLLALNQNKVVPRTEIFSKVWQLDQGVTDRTIDVHIRRLRKKIGDEYIQTVKGVGYRFNPEISE